MKVIKLDLSRNSIQQAIEKLSNLQNDLEKSSKSITKELSDIAFNQVNKNYASSPYTDGNDDVSIISRGTENHQKVGAEGSQVLYREFGTGTEGLNAPHPIKSNFKQADRYETKYVMVIGEDEMNSHLLTIKNNNTKEEYKVDEDDLIDFLDDVIEEGEHHEG